MINQSNYEAFALDYLEGNLSNDMRQAMDAFLKDNPLIKEELIMLQDMVTLVPDDSIVFENKSALMRSESPRIGGAKVVTLKRRFWYKVGATAAAIILVTGGYFMGYFSAGIGQQTNEIVQENHTIEAQQDAAAPMSQQKRQENALAVTESVEHEEVAENSTPKIIQNQNVLPSNNKPSQAIANAPQEPNIAPIEPLPAQEEAIAVTAPSQINLEPLPLTPQREEVNSIAALPLKKVQFDAIELESNLTSKTTSIITNIPTLTTEVEEDAVAEAETKKQKPLKRLRGFLGRLPFQDASASFIPTYYTDKTGEE